MLALVCWQKCGRWPECYTRSNFYTRPPPKPPEMPLKQGKTSQLRAKKPINRKHINIFPTALVGQSSHGRTPPVPGTNGTEWRFYCGINQRKAGLSQGRVPFCPGEGSHLSQGRFLFVPDTVPPKMFMFSPQLASLHGPPPHWA